MDELANELGMIDVVDAASNVSHVPISSSSSTASSTSTIYGPIFDGEHDGGNVPNNEVIPASRTRYNLRSTPKSSFASTVDDNDLNVVATASRSTCKGSKTVQFDSQEDQIIAARPADHTIECIKMTQTGTSKESEAKVTSSSSSPFIRKSFVMSPADEDGCKMKQTNIKSRIISGGGNNTSPDNPLIPSLIGNTRRAMSAHDINLECGGGAVIMDLDTPIVSSDRNSFDRRSLQLPASKNKNHYRPVARSASILLRSKVLILSDSESEEEEHSQSSRGSESRSKSGQSLRKANKRKSRKKSNSLSQGHVKGFTPFGGETSYGNLTYPGQTVPQSSSAPVTSGKRKRSTTISFSASGEHGHSGDGHHHHGHGHHHHHSHGSKMEVDGTVDTMDMDGATYDSSSLSESSIGTDCEANAYEEADDEQSDFYEVMSRVGGEGNESLMDGRPHNRVAVRKYGHHHHHHRTKPMTFPVNPFAIISATSPTPPISSSAALLNLPSTSSAIGAPSTSSAAASAVFWKRRKRNQWQ